MELFEIMYIPKTYAYESRLTTEIDSFIHRFRYNNTNNDDGTTTYTIIICSVFKQTLLEKKIRRGGGGGWIGKRKEENFPALSTDIILSRLLYLYGYGCSA